MALPYWLARLALLRQYPLLAVSIILGLLTIVLVAFPVPQSQTFLAPQGEADRIYFGGPAVVGQQFLPPRGLSELIIPVGTASEQRGPLILHLRETWFGEDVRAAIVYSLAGETARFTFAPLLRPPEKLLWLLEGPHAPPRAYWVYREPDATVTSGPAYLNNQRLGGGIGYALIKRIPTLLAWFGATPLEGYWHRSQVTAWEYRTLLGALIVTAVAILLWPRRRLIRLTETQLLTLLILTSLLLHVWLALHMPLINDEGAYIQDVMQAKLSFIPLRDYLTKGLAYLALLKVWLLLTPHTVLAWRLFPAFFWAAATVALWWWLRQLGMPGAVRIISAALMGLLPGAVALTTPVLVQTTSVPAGLISLVVLMAGLRRQKTSWIALAAIMLAVSFFMRVTTLALGLIGVSMIWLYGSTRRRQLALYVGSGIVTFLTIGALLTTVLGWQRALVAANAEALLIAQHRVEVAQARPEQEPLIRQLTIESRLLWRSAPLLVLGLFLLPLLLLGRSRFGGSHLLVAGYLVVVYQVYWHWRDADYLLPGGFSVARLLLICLVFGSIFLATTLWYAGRPRVTNGYYPWQALLLSGLWLVILTTVYLRWGRFRQSYLVEFIPPLAVITAFSLRELAGQLTTVKPRLLARAVIAISIFLVAGTYLTGWYMVWYYPHTGTIDQASARQFSRVVQQFVPPGETLFTAQPVVTALSQRPIMFGNAHPGWYREARLGMIPEALRDLFFVSPEVVTEFLRQDARFVVYERRTQEIYFDGYPEREQMLRDLFVPVAAVSNNAGGDTLELYERKH